MKVWVGGNCGVLSLKDGVISTHKRWVINPRSEFVFMIWLLPSAHCSKHLQCILTGGTICAHAV